MTDYEKLVGICSEIDELISSRATANSPEFKAWKMKTERFLERKYGQDGIELNNFKGTSFALYLVTSHTQDYEYVKACKNGLLTTKKVFGTYLEEMDEESKKSSEYEEDDQKMQKNPFSKIFIVHGHDGELKEAVARLVESTDIKPVILSEQVNRGATTIEKLEQNTMVPAAICLFTADDRVKEKSGKELRTRARQNVVFETGYLMAKLGRENIIIIAEKGIDIPSDLSGVVYTDKKEWKNSLIKEMQAMGYNVR